MPTICTGIYLLLFNRCYCIGFVILQLTHQHIYTNVHNGKYIFLGQMDFVIQCIKWNCVYICKNMATTNRIELLLRMCKYKMPMPMPVQLFHLNQGECDSLAVWIEQIVNLKTIVNVDSILPNGLITWTIYVRFWATDTLCMHACIVDSITHTIVGQSCWPTIFYTSIYLCARVCE